MQDHIAERLTRIEQDRIQALLHGDSARLDELHDDGYLLCNPTGTMWDKAEYLGRLGSGRLSYARLAATTGIDVLASGGLAVLRYRCAVALRVDGQDIPEHECWHLDVYALGTDGRWRCRWSQATGIMDTVPGAGGLEPPR